MLRSRRGQSVLEYTIIIGIVVVVISYLGTGIKRGVQSLVKVTADQVGNQQNADQDFNDTQQGYMSSSGTMMQENNNKHAAEIGYTPKNATKPFYVTNTSFGESTETMSNTISNGGFSPNG